MRNEPCLIQYCKAKTYAPAGTHALCKEHFLEFVKWRRRRGQTMFFKYGAMTMDERDTIVEEWQKTVKLIEPAAPQPSSQP